MSECSICLNSVRLTRQSKQLECGHLYHGCCIKEWLSFGNTCPNCRVILKKPGFKVTINIENTSTQRSSIREITDNTIIDNLISRFNIERDGSSEVSFSTDTLEELYQIISDFGILDRVDIDSLVLDTE